MSEKAQTVSVRALQAHTYDGKSYDAGDTYDIDAQYVDSVMSQGKAAPTDPAARRSSELTYHTRALSSTKESPTPAKTAKRSTRATSRKK